MHVTYTGPFDEVEIPVLGITAQRGKAIEVDSEVGQSLCEQTDWEQSNGRKKGKESSEGTDA
jgi:hypothetical protein